MERRLKDQFAEDELRNFSLLDSERVTAFLIELLKAPPAGEEEMLLDTFINHLSPGDEHAAYLKVSFLAEIATGKVKCPLITPEQAVDLLATMTDSCNVQALIDLLADEKSASQAIQGLIQMYLTLDSYSHFSLFDPGF